jgi:soluble lytic murein transglycosylase-like protein
VQPRRTPLTRIAYTRPNEDVARLMSEDIRAHRAAALAQIGRIEEAAAELRAGLALATTVQDRNRWSDLAAVINAGLAEDMAPGSASRRRTSFDYPTPALKPKDGFTVNKALVYAIVNQESRFKPGLVSPAGAVGLMQLMPDTAVHATGDAKLRSDMSPLFDPALNLRVGQDYLSWLMTDGVGYDILRTVAAYNGGPATLQKTAGMLGDDDESLMVIECMPALETRNYVEKVMVAYWTYRQKFGQENTTLDAIASGERSALLSRLAVLDWAAGGDPREQIYLLLRGLHREVVARLPAPVLLPHQQRIDALLAGRTLQGVLDRLFSAGFDQQEVALQQAQQICRTGSPISRAILWRQYWEARRNSLAEVFAEEKCLHAIYHERY